MTHPRTSKSSAFTRLELLIVLVVIAIIVAAFLPCLARGRKKAARIHCISHLKNFGLGLRIFSTDHKGSWPWQVSTNQGGSMEYLENPSLAWTHFRALSNEISTTDILICPSDRRVLRAQTFETIPTNGALSFFLGLESRNILPNSILSGDSNLELDGRPLRTEIVLVRTNNTVRFDNTRHSAGDRLPNSTAGNILLGDGSVQQVTSARFQEEVVDSWMGGYVNRWLIP
jgi:competence protein ComGC